MSNQYHEPVELLDEQNKNYTRALMSLKEEIEAVDWYNQRVAATEDADLKEIMAHNRDEEIEHAIMTLEWLRRNMGTAWDTEMRTYLFTEGSIAHLEGADQEAPQGKEKGLNIGNLK
jgi:ferritin-like protein